TVRSRRRTRERSLPRPLRRRPLQRRTAYACFRHGCFLRTLVPQVGCTGKSRAARWALSSEDREHGPLARQPLQLVRPPLDELESGISRPSLHGGRHEHLARARERQDARPDVEHEATEELAATPAFAEVDAGPDFDAERTPLRRDLEGALDGVDGRRERRDDA